MEKTATEATSRLGSSDLRQLVSVEGPCLTITIPLQPAENTAHQDYIRLKSAVRSVESELAARGLDSRGIQELIEPVSQIEGDSWDTDAGTLVVLRSPNTFRHLQLRERLKESAVVSSQFYILSFLRALQEEGWAFFILALSQNHVRLLRCTNRSCEEVPLGAETATNFEKWLSAPPPGTSPSRETLGEMSTGGFTSTSDRDNMGTHVANYFRQIDARVAEVLRAESLPLILTAVDHEASIYQGINTYPHLASEYVRGSAQSLKGGEMHKRALEIANREHEAPMKKALEIYERLGGSERVSSKPGQIVKAAAEGRIAYLFLVDGAQHLGQWDSATMKVTSEGKGEDLLNIAALETLAHGGEVWFAKQNEIPSGGPAAALLRF